VKGYQPRSAEEVEVMRIENAWCDATIKRAASRLGDIFADVITWVEEGGYRNKNEVLHRYMVEVQEDVIELQDVRLRIEGNIAMVSSHILVVKTVARKTTDTAYTSTDVFKKRAGQCNSSLNREVR
jgi:hypothetical protein